MNLSGKIFDWKNWNSKIGNQMFKLHFFNNCKIDLVGLQNFILVYASLLQLKLWLNRVGNLTSSEFLQQFMQLGQGFPNVQNFVFINSRRRIMHYSIITNKYNFKSLFEGISIEIYFPLVSFCLGSYVLTTEKVM